MNFVLAIDQSTSATKAVLFDGQGRRLDEEAREHRQHHPQAGWVEHDAEEIWQNTLGVARTLLARHAEAGAGLACVSLANQRETVVVFERGTGRPLHPAIVWQCRRGEGLCAEQERAGRAAVIHARTGLRLDPYFSASKLQWLVRSHPELARLLAAGKALAGTIDAYLIHRLTGGAVFATDATNASRTLLYDIHRLRWDEELCAWWQVPRNALPEVRECTAQFGTTTLDGALPRPVPICGVMGDSQASLLAQGCLEPGMAKVTFGTGSSVLLNLGTQPRLSDHGVLTALAWVHGGVPTYAFEGIIINSAATLAWLRDQLGLLQDFAEAERLAAAVPDTAGVFLVPAFAGLGLPHWRPEARAALVGLSAHSDRRHVVRAAVESIAYQLRDALDAMRAEAGVPLGDLRVDGGPTVNRLLMQFTADLVGAELRVAAPGTGSARGAALAGLLGVGAHKSLTEVAATPHGGMVYRPSMPADDARRLYAGWQTAVQQVLAGAGGPTRSAAP